MGLRHRISEYIAGLAGRFSKKTPAQNRAPELETILNHIPMAVYWKDSNLIYRGANTEFENMSDSRREDFMGKTDMDFHTKEAAAIFRKEDMEFLRGERTGVYFTDKYVPMSGGGKWVRTYKIPVYDDNGDILYIMGLIQDVTKVKRDEIALSESESRMRTTLNATDDRIVFIDSSGGILAANGSFLRDFAPHESKAEGKCLKDLIEPRFYEKIQQSIAESEKTGQPVFFDFQLEKSLSEKFFEVSVYPVASGGGVIGTAIFAKDITSRKHTEEMLVKRGEQLQLAMAEAISASQSKSEFLSRMSHEIRTPLNAIIGMAKIAGNTDELGKIKDCIQKIDSSSKHLLGIINDVLDMSKIEANKLVLSNDIFRFESMLMDVANVVSVRADEKRQNFEVLIDKALPEYFNSDAFRIRQVITNLISNAIKFTPEYGTIRFYASCLEITDDVADVEMVVSDTGIGISPEQQERLFQPFEQANGGISRKYGGTGLGLVICKAIVEMMGGKIRIESEPGVGSRFIFNMKMKIHHTTENAPVIKFSDMRALIVDDSFETREYLTQILTKFGIRSDVAKDGYEALEQVCMSKLGDDSFNIFFIDWSMPGMDGIETTRKIKAVLDDNEVVIMISITAWNEIEKEANAAGIDRYLSKPLFPSTVLTVLEEIAGTSDKIVFQTDAEGIPDLEGYKILLAEDIEINREITAALLEPTKVQIDFAADGKEAVDKFNAAKDEYDLILMDIHMPEIDGYEATRRIRANEDKKSRHIPIVAMTADAFKEDIDKCKDVGMNDHISKPISEDELYKKILLCLQSKTSPSNHISAHEKIFETDVPVVNKFEALKRFEGNKNLYIKFLKSFVEDKTHDILKESIAAGDMEKACYAAHSIKGMAANLSFDALYSRVSELEIALKGDLLDSEILQDYEKTIEKTKDEIEKYLADYGQDQNS